MSEPEFFTTTSNTRCAACNDKSTWEFLRDFYCRVEVANGYAQRLQSELHEITSVAQQSQQALAHCEASLTASWEVLNQERLDHKESREALQFERESHRETIDLLRRVFREAIRSGEVADALNCKLAELQAASGSGAVQAVSQMTASTAAETSLTPPEAATLTSQQINLAEGLPGTCTSSSPRLTHLCAKEQGTLDQPQNRCSLPPIQLESFQFIASKPRMPGIVVGGSRRSKTRKGKRTDLEKKDHMS